MENDVDLIIVGGGLVGTSLAIALASSELRIAILEKNLPQSMTTTSTDGRPLSLAYSSQQILHALGIWTELNKTATPIHQVHVSERGRLGAVHFEAAKLQVPALGYVVPFEHLQQLLYQHASQNPKVEIITSHDILNIDAKPQGTTVKYQTHDGEKNISAQLLVAADGTHSICRKLLDIGVREHQHGETALIYQIKLTQAHNNIAYERFTGLGVLALLPLHDSQQYRLVWTLPQTQSEQIKQWGNDKIIQHLQHCFGTRLGRIKQCQAMAEFPLQSWLAQRQYLPGAVLIGNAAHTLYPLAAQGFNLGIRDVAVLSELLLAAQQRGQALGDKTLLSEYAKWREHDQNVVAKFTQGLNDVFGLRLPLLSSLRGLGLLATDLMMPLKRRIAMRAMGLLGKQPQLLRQ